MKILKTSDELITHMKIKGIKFHHICIFYHYTSLQTTIKDIFYIISSKKICNIYLHLLVPAKILCTFVVS